MPVIEEYSCQQCHCTLWANNCEYKSASDPQQPRTLLLLVYIAQQSSMLESTIVCDLLSDYWKMFENDQGLSIKEEVKETKK